MRNAPLVFAFALAAGLAAPAAFAETERSQGDAKHGKAIFAENCAVCHGAKAEGGLGPALKAESKRKTPEQIRAQIMDPRPPMAKLFPSVLNEKDVDDVVAYVITL